MSTTENTLGLMVTLVKHEEAVAELYRIFAEKFPEQKDFWSDLSDEESGHADWVRALYAKISEGSVSVHPECFNVPALQTSLNYLKVLLANARQNISPARALSVALQVETSLSENLKKKFFETTRPESEDVKGLFEHLAEGEGEHAAKIRKKMQAGSKA